MCTYLSVIRLSGIAEIDIIPPLSTVVGDTLAFRAQTGHCYG